MSIYNKEQLFILYILIRSTMSSVLNNYDIMNSPGVQRLKSQESTFNHPEATLSDYSLRKERVVENHNTTLCWAEVFVITEDNKTKKKTLSKEYSIIRESPSNETNEKFKDTEMNTYTIVDVKTRKSRTLNFTTVEHTNNFTVMEHKTLYCGAGPVLTHNYEKWPKLGKTKTEVRVSPIAALEWTLSDQLDDENRTTESTASTNFDTIETFISHPIYENGEFSERNIKGINVRTINSTSTTTSKPAAHKNIMNEVLNKALGRINFTEPQIPESIVSHPNKKECIIKGKKIMLPFKNRVQLLNKHINQTVSAHPNFLDHFIKNSNIFESFESSGEPVLLKMVFPLETLKSLKKIGPKQPFRVKIKIIVDYEEGCVKSNMIEDVSTLNLEEETLLLI